MVEKKLALTHQKQAYTNKPEDPITKNKHKKRRKVELACTMSGLERDWGYSYRPVICMELISLTTATLLAK